MYQALSSLSKGLGTRLVRVRAIPYELSTSQNKSIALLYQLRVFDIVLQLIAPKTCLCQRTTLISLWLTNTNIGAFFMYRKHLCTLLGQFGEFSVLGA